MTCARGESFGKTCRFVMGGGAAWPPRAGCCARASEPVRRTIPSAPIAYDTGFIVAPHFNLSAAFAIPAFAHSASLSPPGAPLTATAPIVTSPTLIGTPPWALIVPGIVAGGAAVLAGGGVAGPDGRL